MRRFATTTVGEALKWNSAFDNTEASWLDTQLREVGQTSLSCRIRELLSVPGADASFDAPAADAGCCSVSSADAANEEN